MARLFEVRKGQKSGEASGIIRGFWSSIAILGSILGKQYFASPTSLALL